MTDFALTFTNRVYSHSQLRDFYVTDVDWELSPTDTIYSRTDFESSVIADLGIIPSVVDSQSFLLQVGLDVATSGTSAALAPQHVNSHTDIQDVYLGAKAPIVLPTLSFIDTTLVSLNGMARQLPDGATTSDDPIVLTLRLDGMLELLPPPLAISDVEALQRRVVPNVVVSLPTPAIVNGRPMLPKYWGKMNSSTTAIQGSAHIHAIADPDPKWNPATSGWYDPKVVPSAGVGDGRWTVNSLPDPGSGYYWLGEPSSSDGTVGITAGARQWGADPSTPGAPSWRSIFPYKPSVRNHVYYGSRGNVVTITKGVRFNLHFAEHMWMDFGHAVRMPFTWVMVGIIMDFPTAGYQHYLLDSGRDPRSVGYPSISDADVPYESRINDGLDYRNMMSIGINSQTIGSELSPGAGHRVSAPFNMVARPRMFFGVFNGANSYVGNYSNDGKHVSKGKLATGKDHRFYTLGRQHGYIGINHASHLVVFEMRVWHHALSLAELDSQYGQLASTWKFNQYR